MLVHRPAGSAVRYPPGCCANLPPACAICLVYDCLFPHTVGGAERWYRNLARAARRRRPRGDLPHAAPVGPRRRRPASRAWMCASSGRACRCTSAMRAAGGGSCRRSCSGSACCGTCCGTAGRYDASTPPRSPTSRCSPPAAARPLGRYATRRRLARGVDARVLARLSRSRRRGGRRVRAAVLRARAAARLLLLAAARGAPARRGAARRAGRPDAASTRARRTRRSPRRRAAVVVFAGRHIPEKRVPALLPAFARGARRAPRSCACEVYGDGPERPRLLAEIERLGLGDAVGSARFRGARTGRGALRTALCMVLPSSREGYGLVVVEAAAARHAERRRRRRRTTPRPSWSTTA